MNVGWEVKGEDSNTGVFGRLKKPWFNIDRYRQLLMERDESEVPSFLNGRLD